MFRLIIAKYQFYGEPNDKKKDGKSKGKRKGGNRRERLVSIDDLSEEDVLRRSQSSNASMMSQRADKNKKVEKALEPFQGAINAMAKTTVSTASKAMKDISLVLNATEAVRCLGGYLGGIRISNTSRKQWKSFLPLEKIG